MPGEFHAAEAAHLVAAADQNGDNILSKEEGDSQKFCAWWYPPSPSFKVEDAYKIFLGSQATDYGESIVTHDEL